MLPQPLAASAKRMLHPKVRQHPLQAPALAPGLSCVRNINGRRLLPLPPQLNTCSSATIAPHTHHHVSFFLLESRSRSCDKLRLKPNAMDPLTILICVTAVTTGLGIALTYSKGATPEQAAERVNALVEAGKLAEAEKAAAELAEKFPKEPHGPYFQGRILRLQKKPAEALAAFTRAVEVTGRLDRTEPGTRRIFGAMALNARSEVLESEGDLKGALADMDQGIAQMPDNTALHARRCDLLRKLGRFVDAIEACELAIASADRMVAAANKGIAGAIAKATRPGPDMDERATGVIESLATTAAFLRIHDAELKAESPANPTQIAAAVRTGLDSLEVRHRRTFPKGHTPQSITTDLRNKLETATAASAGGILPPNVRDQLIAAAFRTALRGSTRG